MLTVNTIKLKLEDIKYIRKNNVTMLQSLKNLEDSDLKKGLSLKIKEHTIQICTLEWVLNN